MEREELMVFTLRNKKAVAHTIVDLSCEALSMEPIGEIYYGGSIGEGFDGGASLVQDQIVLTLGKVTGKDYPNTCPGEGVLTHLCSMVAHEVKHAFQRRVLCEPNLIFEENQEAKDEARIETIKKGFDEYRISFGADYELQFLELDAECFAGLVVYLVTGNLPAPEDYAEDLYLEGFNANLEYYKEGLMKAFSPEHFDEVLKKNLEAGVED